MTTILAIVVSVATAWGIITYQKSHPEKPPVAVSDTAKVNR